jgi:hypothetical protein
MLGRSVGFGWLVHLVWFGLGWVGLVGVLGLVYGFRLGLLRRLGWFG